MSWGKSNPKYTSPAWRIIRANVLARDNHRCVKCGRKANEVDHIINVKSGGSDAMSNLQTLCTNHHKAKTLSEAAAGRAARAGSRLRADTKYQGPLRAIP
jgi:5-methylcytosine-specific restriction protein A